MRRLYIAMSIGIAALFGLALWKNTVSYGSKTRKWRVGKSVIDTSLVVLSALYLPALLVGWSVMWLTRPATNRRAVQITLAIGLGILLGTIGGVALEVLCVFGIFSVDLLTGEKGVYGWWNETPPESFMPYLRSGRHIG